jgi:hypothetical protein
MVVGVEERGEQNRSFRGMRRKPPKVTILRSRIADARRIIDAQQALLERLRVSGEPTREAEASLRTYVSALAHLLGHEQRLKLEAQSRRAQNDDRASPLEVLSQDRT